VEQGRSLYGGIVRILRKHFEPSGGRRWPPEGGSASLEDSSCVVPHRIGALPDGIGSRSALPAHARARSGRARWTGPQPVRGHSQNFMKAIRAVGRPPAASGGWLGLSGGQGDVVPHGIGAVPDGIRPRSALPPRVRARSGRPRWNRATTCVGALSEFCESSSSRREAAAGLRRVARPLRRSGAAWCPME